MTKYNFILFLLVCAFIFLFGGLFATAITENTIYFIWGYPLSAIFGLFAYFCVLKREKK